MPIEHKLCYDKIDSELAKTAEENKSWVPNVIQDIYHRATDKAPTYPQGEDACGTKPPDEMVQGYSLERTDIFSNPAGDGFLLYMPDDPVQYHIKGNFRYDHFESIDPTITREPGKIALRIPRANFEWKTKGLFTFTTTDDKQITIEAPEAFLLKDKP